MNRLEQQNKAQRFRELHHADDMLILPNAWDVASAKIFEQAGFSAIATTSAGVAWSLGYADGEHIPRDEMLRAVERIARATALPVSADLEAGYGDTPEAVANTMRLAIEAGAVGVNVEDGTHHAEQPLRDIELQLEMIQAIRETAHAADVPLVINARTDTYVRSVGDEESRFAETVRRANAYFQAGADCAFVIGLRTGETIARLVPAIHGAVNILTGPGAPTIPELARIGVKRVSFGSGPMAASLAFLQQLAIELRDAGTYATLTQNTITHTAMNRMLDQLS